MASFKQTFEILAGDFERAGISSSKIKSLLQQIGIEPNKIRRLAVAAFEAEMNIVIHSLGGSLSLEINPERIVLVAKDVGPGIKNVELAMKEGYSTAPEHVRSMGFGAGMGLPNIRKSADEFEIETNENGTTLTVTILCSPGGEGNDKEG